MNVQVTDHILQLRKKYKRPSYSAADDYMDRLEKELMLALISIQALEDQLIEANEACERYENP